MTHAEYLEAYHEEGEVMRRALNVLLGRQTDADIQEAKATLERWDSRVDALWSQVQTPA